MYVFTDHYVLSSLKCRSSTCATVNSLHAWDLLYGLWVSPLLSPWKRSRVRHCESSAQRRGKSALLSKQEVDQLFLYIDMPAVTLGSTCGIRAITGKQCGNMEFVWQQWGLTTFHNIVLVQRHWLVRPLVYLHVRNVPAQIPCRGGTCFVRNCLRRLCLGVAALDSWTDVESSEGGGQSMMQGTTCTAVEGPLSKEKFIFTTHEFTKSLRHKVYLNV